MNSENSLEWKRGDFHFKWNGKEFATPDVLFWAFELPSNAGVVIVTLIDETTPRDKTNGYVFFPEAGYKEINIKEGNQTVHFLFCYYEQGYLVFAGANSTEYLLDPKTLTVIKSRYYR